MQKFEEKDPMEPQATGACVTKVCHIQSDLNESMVLPQLLRGTHRE